MRVLLGYCPFHSPTSPPLGLACLKAALAERRPEVAVRTVDFNLGFFRGWLLGDPPDLCDVHPEHMLAQVCPALLVQGGQGEALWRRLARLPRGPEEQTDYMRAALELDQVYAALKGLFEGLLRPYIEGRVDLADDTLEQIFGSELAQIEAYQPDVVGLSLLTEENLLYSLALARAVRQRLGLRVALGGALLSHLDPRELLQAFPWIDLVCWGEGETSVPRMLDGWPDAGVEALENIGGLAHRTTDGQPCVHGPPPAPDPAALPTPDFSDFDLVSYLTPAPVLPVVSSRGCYWGKCSFCSHTLPYAPGVRGRSPARVVEELEQLQRRHGVSSFLFVDEAMTPRALRGIAAGILERGLQLRWGAEGIRAEPAFDAELLQLAHEAGLRWIYVGLESTSQRLLDLLHKGTCGADYDAWIENCQTTGITAQLSHIIGIPGTTWEELEQELAFMREHPVDSSMFVLTAGSPMAREPERFGLRIEDRQVLFLTEAGPVHAPRFHVTVERGPSPEAAFEELSSRKRALMRPHLGEIHAVQLADTDFFTSRSRPEAPDHAAARGLRGLNQRRVVGEAWLLHWIGCHEALGNLREALDSVGLALDCGRLADPALFLLHRAALLNRLRRPDLVLALASSEASGDAPALLRGQLTLAHAALEQYGEVVRFARSALEAGHEMPGLHHLLGHGHEELGELEEALAAYGRAEQRDWYEAEINVAQARCLDALGRHAEARGSLDKARRKERALAAVADGVPAPRGVA